MRESVSTLQVIAVRVVRAAHAADPHFFEAYAPIPAGEELYCRETTDFLERVHKALFELPEPARTMMRVHLLGAVKLIIALDAIPIDVKRTLIPDQAPLFDAIWNWQSTLFLELGKVIVQDVNDERHLRTGRNLLN